MARKVIIGRKTKTNINTGTADVGVTVSALSADSRDLEGGVQIVCPTGNTGIVFVGTRSSLTAGTANASDGFPLNATDSIWLPANKESEVFLISDTASQTVSFLSY
jgi:hypothetical protein